MRVKGGVEGAVSLVVIEERRREREDARRAALEFAGEPKGKKKSKTIGDSAFMKTLEEVGVMLKEDRWSNAQGRHFVALYADLYFRVYGMLPADLGPKERVFATKLANTVLEKQFTGNRAEMAKFMAWTWTREKEREKWRRENGRDGGIIDWRFQFAAKLVQSYRMANARTSARREVAR